MVEKVLSSTYFGINGLLVEVEVDLSPGLPSYILVGLPETAVKESKERVLSAIKNSGFVLPIKKIIVNLAPADIKKEGAGFDLPIALGILAASGLIEPYILKNKAFLGELSLDGKLRKIKGVLPITLLLKEKGIREVYLPEENAKEAAIVKDMLIYPVKSLLHTIKVLKGEENIKPFNFDLTDLFYKLSEYKENFSEVKGQYHVKRALEIAAAGGHNVLMIGPPGSGKTMLARRVPSILPHLSLEESLEVTKIHSVAGILSNEEPLVARRPFRSPHHTISAAGMIGGGQVPKPGEVSLANHGVLFLDELPEFKRDVLEVLRQPLEDGVVTISRAKITLTFPSRFMLIAAMNPCPCGYLTDKRRECRCTSNEIKKYVRKISGPLLDRIDIHIEVPAISVDDLKKKEEGELSESIRERVIKAREIQLERYKNEKGIYSNAHLTPKLMKKYIKLDYECENLIFKAIENLSLSARAYSKIIKLSRTIADLEGSVDIKPKHVAEAINYRTLDREYWLNYI
ncbi:MAG: YifB family Mg chelatase-like AAA ATPase [Candidatus Hydrothermales bacterium]